MKKTILRKEPPKRSVLEEIGNAVTHGIGALLGIAGMVLLLLRADTEIKLVSAIVYGTCFLLMFLMSCLYHSLKWGTAAKRVLRRFDYISIYLLIGGTFTPLWLLYLGSSTGIICCIADWIVIVAGIVLIAVFGPERALKIHITMYIILGWSGFVFLPEMVTNDLPLFFFILGGGIICERN